MNVKTILIVLSIFCYLGVFSQSKVHYTLKAEANALMCPFLSPQLMERLAKHGAEEIFKDTLVQLHFSMPRETELSNDFILRLVDDIGYQSALFTISRRYED